MTSPTVCLKRNLEVRGRIVWQNGSSKGIGNTGISSPANMRRHGSRRRLCHLADRVTHACSHPGDYFYVQSGGFSTSAPAITTPLLTDADFTGHYGSTYVRPGIL